MIHILIGTKAQAIKLMPVINQLKQKSIPFNLIDLGQHSLITQELRQEFEIGEPQFYLSKGSNISTLKEGLIWLLRIGLKGISSSWVREEMFQNKDGICLIHGDTASTLIGLYLAKRAHLKVAHLEAGLRSFCWYEPFPEEIIRVIAMKFSDILFAPSQWAFANLVKMGLKEKAVLISANTSLESTFYSLNKKLDLGLNLERFALVTAHRMENIFSKKRLDFIINIISRTSQELPVVFVRHPPTMAQLKKFRFPEKLNKIKNIYFLKILSHAHFISLLKGCEFVVTDGGTIQEEAYYLGKPCLLLRCHTERDEGIGENALLSQLDKEKIDYFLNHYSEFNRPSNLAAKSCPSQEIIEYLKMYV